MLLGSDCTAGYCAGLGPAWTLWKSVGNFGPVNRASAIFSVELERLVALCRVCRVILFCPISRCDVDVRVQDHVSVGRFRADATLSKARIRI
jgi:hypothetical protein